MFKKGEDHGLGSSVASSSLPNHNHNLPSTSHSSFPLSNSNAINALSPSDRLLDSAQRPVSSVTVTGQSGDQSGDERWVGDQSEWKRLGCLGNATIFFGGLGGLDLPWRRNGLAAAAVSAANGVDVVPQWVQHPPELWSEKLRWMEWHVRLRTEWGLTATDLAVIDAGERRMKTWKRLAVALGGALGAALAVAAITAWSTVTTKGSTAIVTVGSSSGASSARGLTQRHWHWHHYAVLSLAASGGALALRWVSSIAAQFVFAQDVWRLPASPRASSLSYEMFVRRQSDGREMFPRARRQRGVVQEGVGLESIPDWVRRPYSVEWEMDGEWMNRLFLEWGMTDEDELRV